MLLFLFSAHFFVEHLFGWFLRPDGVLPPASVWVGQLLHFAMLVGLGMIVFFGASGFLVGSLGGSPGLTRKARDFRFWRHNRAKKMTAENEQKRPVRCQV